MDADTICARAGLNSVPVGRSRPMGGSDPRDEGRVRWGEGQFRRRQFDAGPTGVGDGHRDGDGEENSAVGAENSCRAARR